MSVNRALRRDIADNIAAMLRGEIGTGAFSRRAAELSVTAGAPDAPDHFAQHIGGGQVFLRPPTSRKSRLREKCWRSLRCYLAFLETDLELPVRTEEAEHWNVPALGLTFLCVALLAYFYIRAYKVGLDLIFVLWYGVGGFGLLFGLLFKRRGQQHASQFYPFDSEEHFRKHEHLLDRLHLPDSTPVIRKDLSAKVPIGRFERAKIAVTLTLAVPVFLIFFVCILPITGLSACGLDRGVKKRGRPRGFPVIEVRGSPS